MQLYEAPVDGFLDARPWVASYVRRDFDRVYEHGGVFCIFAAEPFPTTYQYGRQLATGVQGESEIKLRLWDLLTLLDCLHVVQDRGTDIIPTSEAESLGCAELLRGGFFCTVEAGPQQENWLPLARNRWGKTVAGMLVQQGGKGTVVVLPQIEDKSAAVEWVVDELAPKLSPQLFPDRERSAWRNHEGLELPPVPALRAELREVRREAAKREAALQVRIEDARAESAWLLDLLDGTDDVLVHAAKRALEICGLQDVRDADAELAATEPDADRREDLQVHDRSTLLLVEVKGIARPRPRESEALQVAKYLAPRMRDFDRTDIVGLSIINHERHQLPAQRAHEVFGADVIAAASAQQVGLLRAVDLYRLARGVVEHGWGPEVIAERFWQPGLLDGRPAHHSPIGRIIHIFAKNQAIALELSTELGIGNRIAFELEIHTAELEVTSLQQQNASVERASVGEHVGVFVGDLVDQLRDGMEVLVARP